MMTRASLAALAVLFLYGSPAHALTPHTRVAPPGNAGATQYQENVPSASGGIPVTNLPAAGATGQVLPQTVVTQLDHAGTSGRAVAQLANRTAPAAARVDSDRSHSGGSHSGRPPSGTRPLPATTGVGGQLSQAVIGGGGGGLGLLLPVALAASLAIALALVLARHRHSR